MLSDSPSSLRIDTLAAVASVALTACATRTFATSSCDTARESDAVSDCSRSSRAVSAAMSSRARSSSSRVSRRSVMSRAAPTMPVTVPSSSWRTHSRPSIARWTPSGRTIRCWTWCPDVVSSAWRIASRTIGRSSGCRICWYVSYVWSNVPGAKPYMTSRRSSQVTRPLDRSHSHVPSSAAAAARLALRFSVPDGARSSLNRCGARSRRPRSLRPPHLGSDLEHRVSPLGATLRGLCNGWTANGNRWLTRPYDARMGSRVLA